MQPFALPVKKKEYKDKNRKCIRCTTCKKNKQMKIQNATCKKQIQNATVAPPVGTARVKLKNGPPRQPTRSVASL
jgi:hypothetical protein